MRQKPKTRSKLKLYTYLENPKVPKKGSKNKAIREGEKKFKNETGSK